MLRVGHQNVYHLHNKVLDLSVFFFFFLFFFFSFLSVFLNQSAPSYNLFGVTESRLDFRISDQDVNIPDYRIQRKDSTAVGQTGIAVYIHDSIADITHRRHDLESDFVECIWLELKLNANAPSLFVCFFV